MREIRSARGKHKPKITLVPNWLDQRTSSGRELVSGFGNLGEDVAPPCIRDSVGCFFQPGRVGGCVRARLSSAGAGSRLLWVDAMWITPDGRLWMPAAQRERTPGFNDGKQAL